MNIDMTFVLCVTVNKYVETYFRLIVYTLVIFYIYHCIQMKIYCTLLIVYIMISLFRFSTAQQGFTASPFNYNFVPSASVLFQYYIRLFLI